MSKASKHALEILHFSVFESSIDQRLLLFRGEWLFGQLLNYSDVALPGRKASTASRSGVLLLVMSTWPLHVHPLMGIASLSDQRLSFKDLPRIFVGLLLFALENDSRLYEVNELVDRCLDNRQTGEVTWDPATTGGRIR